MNDMTTTTTLQTGQRFKLKRWPVLGMLALTFLLILVLGALIGLFSQTSQNWHQAVESLDIVTWRIIRFTIWQGLLSTLIAVIPALFLARAFWRSGEFKGRNFILSLFAIPLALPAIVAALGVLAIYGRAGFLSQTFELLALGQWPSIYGLTGILIAHAFFNLPLSCLAFLAALKSVPGERWRLASQLDMPAKAQFILIEWPALRAALPAVTSLVFMLCATSFTIVLTLGGGPKATTLEVAIYQALRFDFDPVRAGMLTAIQLIVCALLLIIIGKLGKSMPGESALNNTKPAPFTLSKLERIANFTIIALCTLFVTTPILAILINGMQANLRRLIFDPSVLNALLTSLTFSFIASCLTITMCYGLMQLRQNLAFNREKKRFNTKNKPNIIEKIADQGANLILVVPAIVLGAGWFILLRNFGNVFAFAPFMIIGVNAAMALPFAMRMIRPAYDNAAQRHDRLAQSLSISHWNRFYRIDWPCLRAPLYAGFAFSMALSLGDLGVVALFGSDQVQTLPYLLLARMGSYRTLDAAGIALLLGILCLALITVANKLGKQNHDWR